MRTRLQHVWEVLTSSYWFVPSLMLLSSFGIAMLTLRLDRTLDHEELPLPWLYTGGPDGARTLLSTVASSVITVAGVVFSITIATLTQASSQFGPRLLRNFMRDTGNQVVLGTFVSTFLYCLLVLRTVRGVDDHGFVPHLAVTVAVATGLASLCVLIYFVHHVSFSLQAPHIIARVAADVRRYVERVCARDTQVQEERARARAGATELPADFAEHCGTVSSFGAGYIQAVAIDDLVSIARERELVLYVRRRAGHFVSEGEPLVLVHPGDRLDAAAAHAVADAFILGPARTAEQDPEFAIEQLAEIAVRSLSPGINDPTTAITCVDWLAASLARLAAAELPPHQRHDDRGALRLVLDAPTFRGIVGTAFDQIRQYGRTSVPVTMRLLEALGRIAVAANAEEREVLREQCAMLLRHCETFPEPRDRAAVAERHELAMRAIECSAVDRR